MIVSMFLILVIVLPIIGFIMLKKSKNSAGITLNQVPDFEQKNQNINQISLVGTIFLLLSDLFLIFMLCVTFSMDSFISESHDKIFTGAGYVVLTFVLFCIAIISFFISYFYRQKDENFFIQRFRPVLSILAVLLIISIIASFIYHALY